VCSCFIVHDGRTAGIGATIVIPFRHRSEIKVGRTQHNVLDSFAFGLREFCESRKAQLGKYSTVVEGADIEFVQGIGLGA